jgi:hypothetical protein
MCDTWLATVFELTDSSAAISRLSRPSAISDSTSASRSVRPGKAGAGGAALPSSAASIRPATAAPNTAPPAATARMAASSSSWPAPLST